MQNFLKPPPLAVVNQLSRPLRHLHCLHDQNISPPPPPDLDVIDLRRHLSTNPQRFGLTPKIKCQARFGYRHNTVVFGAHRFLRSWPKFKDVR